MTDKARRLFFALWPDAGRRRALVTAARAVRQHATGRFVPDENLHVTLAFLGSVSPHRVSQVQEAAATLSVGRFGLNLDRAGCWRRAGILWLGATVTPAQLELLVRNLWSALEPHGFRPDVRDFRPHVTVARRCKRAAPDPFEPVCWPVREFTLLESFTGQSGARYTVIGRWPLG